MTGGTKYGKLQEALKAELASGRFRTGDRFYTEREIMEKYGVSGITVARALSEMTEQGYFERKRKLGTFVLESPEMPGMTGNVMTRPLFINRVVAENSDQTRNGPSWFVVEEIRRGVINSYPGAVKIVDMDEIMAEAEKDPELLAILIPQHIECYQKKYAPHKPSNTVEIVLPPYPGHSVNSIRPNYLVGVYEAMEHLIQLGHTRIAFLGRNELRNRYAAYRIALETYGLPFLPELTVCDDVAVNAVAGAALIRRLLALPSPPSAVFCATDKLALGAMQALRELGVKVPEQLSIIGFDDIPAAAAHELPLSTVKVPYFELGKAAVGLLFERMKSGTDVPSKTLMTNYVMRRTTARYQQ
jgi:Transcriptional regulators